MSTRASRGEQFTDVIKRYLVGAPTEVGSIDLASLRRRLDAAALLIEPALAARGIDAIALTKEKIGALGDCERFAAALLSGRTSLGNVDAMARGVLFETLVRSHVTRGVRAYRPPTDARATLELAVELVRAESADHNDDPVRARCLAIGEEESSAWAEQLWGSFRDLVAGWPRFEEAWWPRTEESAKVALGTGTVVLSGRFDIALGGAPTGLPTIVVELKSGVPQRHYVDDQRFYALLATLRDDAAPAAVLTCSASDAGTELATDIVDEPLLSEAVERVESALEGLRRIVVGEPLDEQAGWRCAYCPDCDVCPGFVAPPVIA